MADFAVWDNKNLVKFAHDARDKMIEDANEKARLLRILKALMDEYERVADMYCFVPDRHDAYRQAKGVFK